MGMGFGAVDKAIERGAASGGGGRGDYLPNIFWKDDRSGKGEKYKQVVRFLTDDVFVALFYEFVTGGKPNKEGKQYGREFVAVDSIRNIRVDEDDPTSDLVFPELQEERDFFIVNGIRLPDYRGNLKPAKDLAMERTIGLAVLREAKAENVDGRRREVVTDKIRHDEWETSDGEKKSEDRLQFGLVRQSNKNFWNIMSGYFARYGTICDRDYEITRKGNDKNTQYTIVPLDPIRDLETQEDLDKRYGEHLPITLRDWMVKAARYEEADQWVNWKKYNAEDGSDDSESNSRSGSDAEVQEERSVKAPTGASGGGDLEKELLGYKRT